MAEIIKLQLPISIQDVLKIWARQAGNFEKAIPAETQEKKYMDGIMELLQMFAKHHDEMDDSNFARAFRFFRDAGLTKRLHGDTDISKRYAKLEGLEPDMIIKPDPTLIAVKSDSTSVKIPEQNTEGFNGNLII
jgi:hypothetical protein